MTATEVLMQAATLSAALTALTAMAWSGCWRVARGLMMFLLLSASCDALIMAWPSLWTPAFCGTREAVLAALAAIAALELGHDVLRPAARLWRRVCQRAAVALVPVGLLGAWGMATLVGVQRSGYRGLVAVDAAAALVVAIVLSAVSLYELPRHPLVPRILRALLAQLSCEIVYLGSWEASRALAEILAWPATLGFVWAMLSVAHGAWSLSAATELRPVKVDL